MPTERLCAEELQRMGNNPTEKKTAHLGAI